MLKKPKQLKLSGTSGHGGARSGAGRPKKKDAIVHTSRPKLSRHHPLHVTVRVRKGIPNLRSKDLFKEFKHAVCIARMKRFQIVHFSLLSSHLHMLIEVKDKRALETVMKSFLISFSKRIRSRIQSSNPSGSLIKGLRRDKLSLFDQRYHLTVLKNPTQTRNALRYVLLNEEKHRGFKLHEIRSLGLSQFQSCFLFCDWESLIGIHFKTSLESQPSPSPVHQQRHEIQTLLHPPETWLLREGWKKAI